MASNPPITPVISQTNFKSGLSTILGDHLTPSPLKKPSRLRFSSPNFGLELEKYTPSEMIAILTLLESHKERVYYEGYCMLLNDLNKDGKPVPDRKWIEVYLRLQGTIMAIWNSEQLNQIEVLKLEPSYINITDATFKSISTLPSPSGDLQNVLALSTTLKNRYLLQFSSAKLLQELNIALRLSQFEYTSLQEAYTGGLLSSKGKQLNGIRTLLAETRFAHEDWVSVRFGPGMPWKRCWIVVTPADSKAKSKAKKKGYEAFGTVSFYNDKKKTKKLPIAKIISAQSAYAIYPSTALLIDSSTLFKIEGTISLNDDEKEASVFLMPEQHAGVLGFETLIRILVPIYDAFKLYGRPVRLNADKSDVRSLLFGMPTLPRVNYLEPFDIQILADMNSSGTWTRKQWTENIKELLSRKMSTGYKGSSDLKNVALSAIGFGGNSQSIALPPNVFKDKGRSVSQPLPLNVQNIGTPPRFPLASCDSYNDSNGYIIKNNSRRSDHAQFSSRVNENSQLGSLVPDMDEFQPCSKKMGNELGLSNFQTHEPVIPGIKSSDRPMPSYEENIYSKTHALPYPTDSDKGLVFSDYNSSNDNVVTTDVGHSDSHVSDTSDLQTGSRADIHKSIFGERELYEKSFSAQAFQKRQSDTANINDFSLNNVHDKKSFHLEEDDNNSFSFNDNFHKALPDIHSSHRYKYPDLSYSPQMHISASDDFNGSSSPKAKIGDIMNDFPITHVSKDIPVTEQSRPMGLPQEPGQSSLRPRSSDCHLSIHDVKEPIIGSSDPSGFHSVGPGSFYHASTGSSIGENNSAGSDINGINGSGDHLSRENVSYSAPVLPVNQSYRSASPGHRGMTSNIPFGSSGHLPVNDMALNGGNSYYNRSHQGSGYTHDANSRQIPLHHGSDYQNDISSRQILPHQTPLHQIPPHQNSPHQIPPYHNSPHQIPPHQNSPHQIPPHQGFGRQYDMSSRQIPPYQNFPYQNSSRQTPPPQGFGHQHDIYSRQIPSHQNSLHQNPHHKIPPRQKLPQQNPLNRKNPGQNPPHPELLSFHSGSTMPPNGTPYESVSEHTHKLHGYNVPFPNGQSVPGYD